MLLTIVASLACPARQQAGRLLGDTRRIDSAPTIRLRRLHPVMADAPFAAVGIAEQPCGREKEPAPAPHPQRGIIAVDRVQNGFDLVAMRVEIAEPVERGALVMRAAPAPFLLDFEQLVILPDQMMARHHPAGEEMLRD